MYMSCSLLKMFSCYYSFLAGEYFSHVTSEHTEIFMISLMNQILYPASDGFWMLLSWLQICLVLHCPAKHIAYIIIANQYDDHVELNNI